MLEDDESRERGRLVRRNKISCNSVLSYVVIDGMTSVYNRTMKESLINAFICNIVKLNRYDLFAYMETLAASAGSSKADMYVCKSQTNMNSGTRT
jgi:hypothetical protein